MTPRCPIHDCELVLELNSKKLICIHCVSGGEPTTPRCREHHRPLVEEHTSKKLICIPCYFAAARERRNAVVAYTDPRTRRKKAQARTYQNKKQEAMG